MGETRRPHLPKFGHFLTSSSTGDHIPEHPKTPPCNRGMGGDRVAALREVMEQPEQRKLHPMSACSDVGTASIHLCS